MGILVTKTPPPLGRVAQEVYDELEPLRYAETEPDVPYDHPLAKYVQTLCYADELVDTLARDTDDGKPGWSIIVDIDRCPDEFLPWLAQLVGVVLDPTVDADANRERIRSVDGANRGTTGAVLAAAAQHLSLQPSYRRHVQADRPLGFWPLMEFEGATAYDYGSGNHDFTYNTFVGGLGESIILDQYETIRSTKFDGVNDQVVGTDSHDFVGTAPFSVECWVKAPNLGPTAIGLVNKLSTLGGNNGYELDLIETLGIPKVRFTRWLNGTGNALTADQPLNVPTHIVGTYNGTTMGLWVNGVKAASGASSLSLLNNTAPLVFGSRLAAGFYSEVMSHVAVYDYALDDDRIIAHYSAGLGAPVDKPGKQFAIALRERYFGDPWRLNVIVGALDLVDKQAALASLQAAKPAGIAISMNLVTGQTWNEARLRSTSWANAQAQWPTWQQFRDTIAV